MSRFVTAIAAAALLLHGCGGGSDGSPGATGATGPTGPAGPAGTPGKDATAAVKVLSNSVAATADASAAWKAFQPQVTVTSVTIASPPVVKFTVKDASGNPVVGLGSTNQASTAIVPSRTNLSFTLAKLVSASGGNPSKWVSYLVTRPPTVAEKAGTVAATTSCNSTTAPTVCGTFPTSDSQGTLVDNGDGSYVYTFYRDIKQAAADVASLIDTANGLNKKADLGDVSYDANATHRLGIIISGAAPGTGSNTPNAVTLTPAVNIETPGNFTYDFVPAGGTPTVTRDIVQISSCSECHAGKGLAHGASRKDPKLCVTCHTDQVRYSFSKEATMLADGLTFAVQSGSNAVVRPEQAVLDGRAVGNFPNYIHKLHMGERLVKQGYNYNNDNGAMLFNEVRYPQAITNCVKCHDGSATAANKTANGDNWKSVPSRLACGSCHDGINFATGLGYTAADKRLGNTAKSNHTGGSYSADTQCAICHNSTDIDIATSHQAMGFGSETSNKNYPYSVNGLLPTGAYKIEYAIKSVSVNAAGNPSVSFQILKNGAAVNFGVYDAATNANLIANTVGGPSVYFAYNYPQDGITSPSDYNARVSVALGNGIPSQAGVITKGLWAGTGAANVCPAPWTTGNQLTASGITWTLCADAAATTYTVTADIKLPASTTILTGALLGTMVQTNVAGYPYSAAAADWKLREGSTTAYLQTKPGLILTPVAQKKELTGAGANGSTFVARRTIVNEANCNSCHKQLGTQPVFHGGSYNVTVCAICHNPNRTSSGWAVDSRQYLHAIHGAEKRGADKPFNWQSALDYPNLGYPGVLKKCTQCHVAGTYDFSASNYTGTLMANLLWPTAAAGTMSTTAPVSSDVVPGTNYGAAYGSSGPTWAAGVPTFTAAAGTTLVTSPISVACYSCHASDAAKAHMKTNGGAIYAPRSTVTVGPTEACLTCHGPNAEFAIAKVHK